MKMNGKLVILALLLATGACEKSDPETKRPSDVIVAAYMAANDGKYSAVEPHLSSEFRNAMKSSLGTLAGGTKGVWDRETRDGTVQRIEILEENVRGEGATVSFRIHYEDGETETEAEPLIMEDGIWKITID